MLFTYEKKSDLNLEFFLYRVEKYIYNTSTFLEFVLVLCNDGKKSGARKKNRKGKKHRPPTKIPTDATEAGGSSLNMPSRSQVSETKWRPPMFQAVQSL